jgi:hypothetical protein
VINTVGSVIIRLGVISGEVSGIVLTKSWAGLPLVLKLTADR